MKITAKDLKDLDIIDEIIKEPVGGAQNNSKEVYKLLKKSIIKNLNDLMKKDKKLLIEERYKKFRIMGQKFVK